MTADKGNAAQIDSRNGLEQVQALAAGEYPASPMTELMPFKTFPPERGSLKFEATPDETHLNGFGVVHGGWTMTMLDNAMGLAAHSTVAPGEYCPSKETSVQFRGKILATGKPLTITAWVTKEEDREVEVAGQIVGPDGKTLATGTSTCVIIRP